jgi:lycopene beta-cyclase
VQQSNRYRYCHIAADDFYRLALQSVEMAPEQTLCRGVTVQGIGQRPDGLVAVETDRGRILAAQVFDSRPQDLSPPQARQESAPVLLQRFLGWHVRTAAPRFDPATAVLMDFLPAGQPGRVRFLYLLPFSATEALVEMTYLDQPGLPEPPAESDLRAWLEEHAGDYEVLYTERGSLPMTPWAVPTNRLPQVHPIGIRGGRLKASSGYGFLRIQRHSRAIAQALATGAPVPQTAEPKLYGTLDSIFLRAARRSRAPELFLSMFEGTGADPLVRFLGETSPAGEILRVAWSLPKLPMIRAAMRAALTVWMPA